MGSNDHPSQGGSSGTSGVAVVAVVAAAAVVVAAGVTGFLVLSDDGGTDAKDAKPEASASASPSENPRAAGDEDGPVIPGWKVVARPGSDVRYDVPPDWDIRPGDWRSYVADDADEEEIPLVGFGGVATLKEEWCTSDDDQDGTLGSTALANVGTRVERGARNTEEAARDNADLWVYGKYTQPDKDKVETGEAEEFTTASGLKGHRVTAASSGVDKPGKCATDGKAVTFAFKNSKNDFASWTFVGAKGVPDEVPDATIDKILSTVRLAEPAKPS
ncbi:hypothetical protein U9R90_14145 [Streptomyces sp. E11-3]|uniref:hypothetical protein n=1 Tax=Streptomyces sp. E11-3 TaxID=3110112 RepID=UPI00397EC550